MKQQSLASQAAFEKYGRKSRRELFLDEMEQIVPWGELAALVEPNYAKAGNGRRPVGVAIMLRTYFLQQWFNLSDPGVEEALYESAALRRFAAGPSVEKARQCTAGGDACDVYATADSSNIDLFLKPAGYADFTIVFAQGRMVLGYSASGLAQKKLPPIADPNSGPFNPLQSIPKAVDNWYRILTRPGVAIGGGVPYLDPGAYRAYLIIRPGASRRRCKRRHPRKLPHGPLAHRRLPELQRAWSRPGRFCARGAAVEPHFEDITMEHVPNDTPKLPAIPSPLGSN